jgi:S-adenosylmethionine hydrolase
MRRTIALLTDFGTTDTYVGVMRGVMLGIAPDAQFADLTHAVQPQNIKQAAFLLLNSYHFFPPETIFLVVVDPGVGSIRKPIAVRAGGYNFVAPDNGVLSYVLSEIGRYQTVQLENEQYRLAGTSNTFHGRDIFAPAVAHLASGVALERFGGVVKQPLLLPEPTLIINENRISGEVLHVDHFGTAVTSIGILNWSGLTKLTLTPRFGGRSALTFSADTSMAAVGDQHVAEIKHAYAEVGQGEALALVGSSGYLELSINGGNFAERFGMKIGDPVELQVEQIG